MTGRSSPVTAQHSMLRQTIAFQGTATQKFELAALAEAHSVAKLQHVRHSEPASQGSVTAPSHSCWGRVGVGRTGGIGKAPLLHGQEGVVVAAVRDAAPIGVLGVVGDADQHVGTVHRHHAIGDVCDALSTAGRRETITFRRSALSTAQS